MGQYYATNGLGLDFGSMVDQGTSYLKGQGAQLADKAKVEAQQKIEAVKARAAKEALDAAAKGQAAIGQRILNETKKATDAATNLISGGGAAGGGSGGGSSSGGGTSGTKIAGIGVGTLLGGLAVFLIAKKLVS